MNRQTFIIGWLVCIGITGGYLFADDIYALIAGYALAFLGAYLIELEQRHNGKASRDKRRTAL